MDWQLCRGRGGRRDVPLPPQHPQLQGLIPTDSIPAKPQEATEAVAWPGARASRPTPACLQGGFYSVPPFPFFFPPPPLGSQLLITFACQPGLLICYRRAESGRSENKGDTITLCLLSSPIQISFID